MKLLAADAIGAVLWFGSWKCGWLSFGAAEAGLLAIPFITFWALDGWKLWSQYESTPYDRTLDCGVGIVCSLRHPCALIHGSHAGRFVIRLLTLASLILIIVFFVISEKQLASGHGIYFGVGVIVWSVWVTAKGWPERLARTSARKCAAPVWATRSIGPIVILFDLILLALIGYAHGGTGSWRSSFLFGAATVAAIDAWNSYVTLSYCVYARATQLQPGRASWPTFGPPLP